MHPDKIKNFDLNLSAGQLPLSPPQKPVEIVDFDNDVNQETGELPNNQHTWWMNAMKVPQAWNYSLGTGVKMAYLDGGYVGLSTSPYFPERRVLYAPQNSSEIERGEIVPLEQTLKDKDRKPGNHAMASMYRAFSEFDDENQYVGSSPNVIIMPFANVFTKEQFREALRLAYEGVKNNSQYKPNVVYINNNMPVSRNLALSKTELLAIDEDGDGQNDIEIPLTVLEPIYEYISYFSLFENIPVVNAAQNQSGSLCAPEDIRLYGGVFGKGLCQVAIPSYYGDIIDTITVAGLTYAASLNELRFDNGSNFIARAVWAPLQLGRGGISGQFNEAYRQFDPQRFADPYEFINGTSGAGPVIAGVVNLMKSRNPDLKPAQIRDILLNYHPTRIKNALTETNLQNSKPRDDGNDTFPNRWAPSLEQDYKDNGLRLPNVLKAVERAIQLKENPSNPDACQDECLKRYLPQEFVGWARKDAENKYSLIFNDGTVYELLMSSEAQKTLLPDSNELKPVRILGWTGIHAGPERLNQKIEILKVYGEEAPRPHDDPLKQLKPRLDEVRSLTDLGGVILHKSNAQLGLKGSGLFASIRETNLPGKSKFYLQVGYRPENTLGEFTPIDSQFLNILNENSNEEALLKKGEFLRLKIDALAFEGISAGYYEFQFKDGKGNVIPFSKKNFQIQSTGTGIVLSLEDIGFTFPTGFDPSTPPKSPGEDVTIPERATLWLLRDSNRTPIRSSDMVGVYIDYHQLDDIEIEIDGQPTPIREIDNDSRQVLFQLSPDLAPGVKDVLIKLAGSNVTLEEAIEVLALEPLVKTQNIGYGWVYTAESHKFSDGRNFLGFAEGLQGRSYFWSDFNQMISPYYAFPSITPTHFEFFEMDGIPYMSQANYGRGSNKPDPGSAAHLNIRRLDVPGDHPLFVVQNLFNGRGIYESHHFQIGSEHYLATAEFVAGAVTETHIYKWNGLRFIEYQTLPTGGSLSLQSFHVDNEHYLVINVRSDQSGLYIYKWDGTAFQLDHQMEAGPEYFDLEAFTITDRFMGRQLFLASIDNYPDPASGLKRSRILKWNSTSQRFDEFQSFLAERARTWHHFEHQGVDYLTQTSSDLTRIYRWDGVGAAAQFKLYRSIPSNDDTGAVFMEIENNPTLVISHGHRGSAGIHTLSEAFRFE